MKRQRFRFRFIALLLFACFLLVGLYGLRSVRVYGTRWFSHAGNTRLAALKSEIIQGDILDRNGIVLATTQEGKRVYHSDAATRSALVHVIGDRAGNIAGSVESFQAGYLYGFQSSLLDAINHLIRREERRGNTLELTVDAELSASVAGWFSSHPTTRGKSGAAIAMNYLTGEVLCLVSLPDYDPDHATPEAIAALDQPYWNRATQALIPPGSTFKTVTAAAFLRRFPDALSRTWHCDGSLPVTETYSVKDFGGAVHGDLGLRDAYLHSCNSVFASMALTLGNDALRSAAESFGFNENFLFRDLVVTNSVYPREDQSPEALAASGFGQSAIAATPMHVCLIAAAVANQGVMPEPRLLKNVRAASGATVLSLSPAAFRTVCSGEVAARLQSMMKDVVQRGGSGSRAAVTTLDICGKTGTAESTLHGEKVNYGWFTGFNAQKDLPVALCVLVEDIPEGETGGTTAAVIAGNLFTWFRNHPDHL